MIRSGGKRVQRVGKIILNVSEVLARISLSFEQVTCRKYPAMQHFGARNVVHFWVNSITLHLFLKKESSNR